VNLKRWESPFATEPRPTCESAGKAFRKIWGGKRESNPQPSEPQSGALPVELFPPLLSIIATEVRAVRVWFRVGLRRAARITPAKSEVQPRQKTEGEGKGESNQSRSESRATNHRPPNFYPRPTPTYSNPSARSRVESSRFFVSTMTGLLSRCLMRSKSSARNSGQPVPTTRASEPSAAA
jgi:hypothetical protein